MGVYRNVGIPKWLVYDGKSHLQIDDDLGVHPNLGNLQIVLERHHIPLMAFPSDLPGRPWTKRPGERFPFSEC